MHNQENVDCILCFLDIDFFGGRQIIMTAQEIWSVKQGQVLVKVVSKGKDIYDWNNWAWSGTVTSRKVYDEVCGFVLSASGSTDLCTGRKYVELTVKADDNYTYFICSNSAKYLLDKIYLL